MTIPLIDDRIKHVGVTHLRRMNAETVGSLKDVFVFQVDGKNAAVLFPYDLYLELQQALWPSTLIPSLEEVFKSDEDEDREHPDFSALLPDGPDLPAPPAPRKCSKCGSVANPSIGGGVFDKIVVQPLICPSCVEATLAPGVAEAVERIVSSEVTALAQEEDARATDLTPAHPGPMVIERFGLAPSEPLKCAHCGKPNEKPLCTDCFMAGHRNQCTICGDNTNA